ncbi:hypothetical protein E2C01_004063 [Portunus trituberculatus]|uniref:Uncharacterized protein n=1 Tax=Portunus trituberculatus TaxID=210409 RepID=A0A5B7CPM7_PORTR|nr:hypothetical protein [Portunus trituberculatus]
MGSDANECALREADFLPPAGDVVGCLRTELTTSTLDRLVDRYVERSLPVFQPLTYSAKLFLPFSSSSDNPISVSYPFSPAPPPNPVISICHYCPLSRSCFSLE